MSHITNELFQCKQTFLTSSHFLNIFLWLSTTFTIKNTLAKGVAIKEAVTFSLALLFFSFIELISQDFFLTQGQRTILVTNLSERKGTLIKSSYFQKVHIKKTR